MSEWLGELLEALEDIEHEVDDALQVDYEQVTRNRAIGDATELFREKIEEWLRRKLLLAREEARARALVIEEADARVVLSKMRAHAQISDHCTACGHGRLWHVGRPGGAVHNACNAAGCPCAGYAS